MAPQPKQATPPRRPAPARPTPRRAAAACERTGIGPSHTAQRHRITSERSLNGTDLDDAGVDHLSQTNDVLGGRPTRSRTGPPRRWRAAVRSVATMASATEDYVRNLMRPALRRQFQPIALRVIAE